VRSGNGFFKVPEKKKLSCNGMAYGKSLFEDQSPEDPDYSDPPSVSVKSGQAYVPPTPDEEFENTASQIGSGPYQFDVNSVPPAPSHKGRIEVERLIHAYKISGSQMEVDPEFIKRLIAFHRGYMVMPR
jgi:hypothetical protein